MDDYGIASVGDTDRPRQAITNLAEARRGGMDITSTLMDFTELYTIQNAQIKVRVPECYTVEDDYFKSKSTVELNRHIKYYRVAIARAGLGSGNLICEKDKLSSIIVRRKSPVQREILCARIILVFRNEIVRKLETVVKCEKDIDIFLEFQDQVAGTKPRKDRKIVERKQ